MMQSKAYALGTLSNYRYVVTYARYQGKWVFCKHKKRRTWEASGGHIEPGETPLDAARRELYEETGAVQFEITPVCDYWASDEDSGSNGVVFVADIAEMGPLPDSEMERIALFDDAPEALTYPDIMGVIFPLAKARYENA